MESAPSNNLKICTHCSKVFKTNHGLSRYAVTHDDNAQVDCEVCGKTFKNYIVLSQHVNVIHGKKIRPRFPCSMSGCSKTFSTPAGVKNHYNLEHVSDPVRFQCTLCDKKFKAKPNLEYHIASHTTEKGYKCLICEKRFARPNYIKQHMELHQDNSDRNVFKCHICSRSYMSASGISYHIRTHNKPGVEYHCTICDKRLKTYSGLRYHMIAKHEEKKRPTLSCEKCEYKTWVKSKLTTHFKRMHENEKRHQCYFCSKKFFALKDLVGHCNRIHTLEK
ncbi:zinc finger protein 888-like [Folsomia candida]|uniref:zinc finger protein 888-like n=1 Tax=Folsomia candida TaxID=158441 RepID=UPI0016052914|nr:zinc finger protein 888-like [Folsomia candida]